MAAERAATVTRLDAASSPTSKIATNTLGVALAASDSSPYIIDKGVVETFKVSETAYTFPVTDRVGTTWTISRKYSDFEKLHETIQDIYMNRDGIDTLQLPPKFSNLSFPSSADQTEMCHSLQMYLQEVVDGAVDADTRSKKAIAEFICVKNLDLGTRTRCRSAENIQNYFVDLATAFTEALTIANYGIRKEATSDEKAMAEFRECWGHDGVFMILRAHGYLQRMATILGWTLELNHYFVSMFGNLISFSKLPIREMLLTQKDVMTAFMVVSGDIYTLACTLNAHNKYKWHKNLHVAESELQRTRFHLNKSVETICRIEHEHLDKDIQMRRLQDVASRFAPFMAKVGSSLPTIQKELGLPVHTPPEDNNMDSISGASAMLMLEGTDSPGSSRYAIEPAESKDGSSDEADSKIDEVDVKIESKSASRDRIDNRPVREVVSPQVRTVSACAFDSDNPNSEVCIIC